MPASGLCLSALLSPKFALEPTTWFTAVLDRQGSGSATTEFRRLQAVLPSRSVHLNAAYVHGRVQSVGMMRAALQRNSSSICPGFSALMAAVVVARRDSDSLRERRQTTILLGIDISSHHGRRFSGYSATRLEFNVDFGSFLQAECEGRILIPILANVLLVL